MFTRISDTEARCVMADRTYDIVRVHDDSDEWIISPRLSAADIAAAAPRLPWYFLRRQAGVLGYCVHRAGGEAPVVGYAESLLDAAWPADRDLTAGAATRTPLRAA